MKNNVINLASFTIILLCVSLSSVLAQKDAKKGAKVENTYVSPDAKLSKVHTQEELEKLGKIELTNIYKERISILTEIIPYVALHPVPGATLTEMGIPQTPENISHLEKEVKNKAAYATSVNDTLDDIIPYADKKNIVWAILFFERMIQEANYTSN